jgi:hypothetical protein
VGYDPDDPGEEHNCGFAPADADFNGVVEVDYCAQGLCSILSSFFFYGEIDTRTITLEPRCGSSSTTECVDLAGPSQVGG